MAYGFLRICKCRHCRTAGHSSWRKFYKRSAWKLMRRLERTDPEAAPRRLPWFGP